MNKDKHEVSTREMLHAARTYAALMLVIGIIVSMILTR